jgi:hypothetical protein
MRTVKTTSGATAVQVVWSSRRGSREVEHLGPAHDDAELEALRAAAQQRIAAGQLELALGLVPAGGGPLPVTSSRMGHLLDALEHAYRVLGLEAAAGGDEVFRHLVLAALAVSRWIEAQAGWSIRKFVTTARRYRTIEIQAGRQAITAVGPLPDDLRQALQAINRDS